MVSPVSVLPRVPPPLPLSKTCFAGETQEGNDIMLGEISKDFMLLAGYTFVMM